MCCRFGRCNVGVKRPAPPLTMKNNLESTILGICQYGVVATFAFGCYFNSLFAGFVFDDTEAIIKNKDVLPSTPIVNIFHNDFWGTELVSNLSHKSYRPLTILTYRLNILFADGEINPLHFHVVNIALYIVLCLVALSVFRLFLNHKRSKGVDVSFLSALLFASHPVHTEAVTSIVGRGDILAALLLLIAFVLYAKAVKRQNYVYVCVSLVLIAVATLCKETAIMGLALCFVYDFILSYTSKTSQFWVRLPLLVLTGCATLYFRFAIMDFKGPNFTASDNPAAFSSDVFTRFFTYNYVYLLNAVLLIWPEWLCFDWSMGCIPLIESYTDFRIVCVVAFWAMLTLFAGVTAKKMLVTGLWQLKPVIMGVAFVFLPFLPASNLFLRVGFVIAERILLIPSLGFCFLVTMGFEKVLRRFKSKRYIGTFYFPCLVFALRTILRNNDWLNEENLFYSALDVCPSNAKVHYNIAKVFADNLKTDFAIAEYKKAIELNGNYEQAMNNLANLLREKKQFYEAEILLRRALEIRSNFAAAWMNLGIVLTNQNRTDEAEQCYLAALSFRKKYPDCYYNLGNLYLDLKRNEEALKAWELAVQYRPTHTAAWSNTLVLLDALKDFQSVQKLAKVALMHNPASAALHFCLANTLGKVKQFEQAEKHFLEALNLSPSNALYYSNLGVLYHRWGKPEKAIKMYRNALKIEPGMKTAQGNLKKLLNM